MKRLFWIFLFLAPFLSQGQFVDDFADSNFTANPVWTGDTGEFIINATKQLQLDGPGQTDTNSLRTPLNVVFTDTITWEFWLEMGFNPSNNNNVRVYLASDQPDLKGALNGYYLRIGESGSADALKLYTQSGSSSSLFLTGSSTAFGTTPVARVRIQRDPLGNWTMWADSTGGTTFTVQGTAQETTHNSTSWFGVWCKHTSSNNDNYFFDDFNVSGQIFVDTTAPALVSLNPTSTTTLEVQFTESVDPTTAQNVNNYSADNGLGNPISATIDGTDPAQVNLVFGSAFQNGVNYSLTVSDVEDLFSNAMTTASLPFSFFSSPPAAFQDVVINEIFPDPSPPVALPEEEFLELFNASSETFDLSGWEYSDASTTVTLPSYVLAPGDHLILCAEADTALFSPLGDVLGLGSWPALNNGGDDLSLRDNQGTLIDQANYDLSWYRDPSKESGGFSLERINPFFDCGGAGNWIGSSSFDGGTPGVQNAAFDTLPDVVQPNLTTIIVNSTFQITVNFDEGLDSASLATASFVVDNGATVTNITPNPPAYESVTLDFATALSTTTLYSLTINGASDCWGNTLNNNQGTFGIGEAPTTPFQVVINEIFPDPDASLSALPEGEFVEIYNRSDDLLNLEGYLLWDATSSGTIQGPALMPGKSYLILCPSGEAGLWSGFGPVAEVSSFPSLNNSGDELRLTDATETVTLDEVPYSDTWYQDDTKSDGGWTLERVNPESFCFLGTNWRASNDNSGGTPGAENSIFDPNAGIDPVTIAGVTTWPNNTVIITFNQQITASTDPADYSFSPSLGVDSVAVNPILPIVLIQLSQPIQGQTQYTLTVTGTGDCTGAQATIDPNNFYQAGPGDILINEVLFNPRGSGTDFVELYNNTDFEINLQWWGLVSSRTADTVTASPITLDPQILPARTYLLLNEDNDNIQLEYPQTETSVLLETDLPSYSNADGEVVLWDTRRQLIDSFAYDEDFHFALLADPEGVSLERRDFDRSTSDPTNWHSAAEDAGWATPGFQNSQFDPVAGASNEVTIEPEAFSPNNDGMDDVANISYRFSEPGFVANITIYDSRGRLVRRLVENELLGVEGTFSWDGITDDREKARTGIYVVFFEAFDLDGEVERFKKPCVLATKF